MSYKVVRDISNNVICFGLNTEQYKPIVPTGCTLTIEETLPTKSLLTRQSERWELIKQKRTSIQDGGVLVGTKWYHSDSDSRIQQLGLVMMGASIPANLQWKTMDGSFVLMTQTLAGQIFNAVATHDALAFANAETHRAAMLLSITPETYDFSAGWPVVYVP